MPYIIFNLNFKLISTTAAVVVVARSLIERKKKYTEGALFFNVHQYFTLKMLQAMSVEKYCEVK